MTCQSPLLNNRTLLFAVALTCFTAWAGQSFALSKGTASLGKAWIVSPVQSPSDPQRRYCTMTQGYSNGISLVYAQEKNAAAALALEFSSDVLRDQKSVTLSLSSGAFARNVETTPVSTRALVAQMGVDGALRNAMLQKNAVIDVALGGQTIAAFRMDKAAEAFTALDGCVKAVSQGKMPDTVHIETGSTTVKIIDKSVYEETPKQPEMPQGAVNRSFKEIAWPQSEKFEDVAASYISSEAARCTADFAHKVSPAVRGLSGPAMKVEIACMGHDKTGVVSERDYAAALLFVGKNNKIEIVSFEGPAMTLPEALARRDAGYNAVTTP